MKLPTDLSGQRLCRALARVGFVFQRQAGSHMILLRNSTHKIVVVPDHKTLRPGTLKKILNDADVSVEQLISLL